MLTESTTYNFFHEPVVRLCDDNFKEIGVAQYLSRFHGVVLQSRGNQPFILTRSDIDQIARIMDRIAEQKA